MKNSQLNKIVIGLGLAAFVLVSSIFILAEATKAASQKVRWSSNDLLIKIPAGTSVSQTLTITSVYQISNVNFEPHPQIANIVNISPASIPILPAGQPRELTLSISVPGNAPIGKINSYVEIREGTKALNSPLRLRIEILEPIEQVISETSGILSSSFGRLEIPDFARIELLPNPSRPPITYTLHQVSAPQDDQLFGQFLESEGLPQFFGNSFLRVIAGEQFPGGMGLKVKVPSSVLESLSSDIIPELYVELFTIGDNGEAYGEWIPLMAEFNAETGELTAPLSSFHFVTLSEGRLYGSAAAGSPVSASIRVSITNQLTRPVPISGQFTSPSSEITEIGIRDTLQISGNLHVNAPLSLNNPTIYEPFVVTSPFGANHSGVDLRSRTGDAIKAAESGTVLWTGYQPPTGNPSRIPGVGQQSGGWAVRITHPDGSVTGYAHLREGSILVTNGQDVDAGQTIAQANESGGVQGAHLHMSYTVGGQRVDPALFIGGTQLPAYLNNLSVVTAIDGTPIESTRRSVTHQDFSYNASLSASTLPNIQPGRTYALTISAEKDGQSAALYRGRLRIRPSAMRVVLTWNKNDTDVDLHVRDSLGNHSWYGNLCGIPNGCLDHDDVNGFGPETFSLTNFAPSVSYVVSLHYYSDHGNGPTTASVQVYVDNELVTNSNFVLSNNQTSVVGSYPQANSLRVNSLLVPQLIPPFSKSARIAPSLSNGRTRIPVD